MANDVSPMTAAQRMSKSRAQRTAQRKAADRSKDRERKRLKRNQLQNVCCASVTSVAPSVTPSVTSPGTEIKKRVRAAGSKFLSPEQRVRFDAFWKVYPRKVGKVDAEKAWKSLLPDDTLLATIVEAVKKQTPIMGKDGPTYIPHPATWLNGRRWEDEVGTPKSRFLEARDRHLAEIAARANKEQV